MTMQADFNKYFECDKPAKYWIKDTLRGRIVICGIHAKALRNRGRNPQPLK